MDNGAWQATVHGTARVRHDLATNTHTHTFIDPTVYMRQEAQMGTVLGKWDVWSSWLKETSAKNLGRRTRDLCGLKREGHF